MSSRARARAALRSERTAKALRMRASGSTWDTIARSLGYHDRGHAHRDCQRAMDDRLAQLAAEDAEAAERRAGLEPTICEAWARLSDLVDDIGPWAMFAESPRQVLDAIGTLTRHATAAETR